MRIGIPLALILGVALLSPALSQQQNSTNRMQSERLKLQRLDREYRAQKRSFESAKSNPARRKSFVDATVKYGTAVMLSPALTPKEKYPRALRLYREALKLDPNNREARANMKMIEDIYRQMGKPVPK